MATKRTTRRNIPSNRGKRLKNVRKCALQVKDEAEFLRIGRRYVLGIGMWLGSFLGRAICARQEPIPRNSYIINSITGYAAEKTGSPSAHASAHTA